MTNINDVPVNDLIAKTAEELKKDENIIPPEWAKFVKTGQHKERTPVQDDWWYIRAAAVLRKVKILGPVGTQKLRTKYGGKKRRGHQPAKTFKGSGSIIRKVLQQLEKSGLIAQTEKGVHKGRVVTGKGDKVLSNAVKSLK